MQKGDSSSLLGAAEMALNWLMWDLFCPEKWFFGNGKG